MPGVERNRRVMGPDEQYDTNEMRQRVPMMKKMNKIPDDRLKMLKMALKKRKAQTGGMKKMGPESGR